jgi:hypothetical protein
MRTCPKCALVNPDSAIVCDCGQVLDAAAAKALSPADLQAVEPTRQRAPVPGGAPKILVGIGGFVLGGMVQGMVVALLGLEGLLPKGMAVLAGIAGVVVALWLLERSSAPTAGRRRQPGLRDNYLSRHWRGDLPLGVSYWANGWLVAMLGPCTIRLLTRGASPFESRYVPLLSLLAAWVVIGIGSAWYSVGTWRASDRPTAGGRMSSWSGAAKAGVVIGAIILVAVFTARGLPAMRAALDQAR